MSGARAVARAMGLAVFGLAGCASHAAAPESPRPAPLPPPRVTAGDLDPRELLGELPARASRLGAGAPSMIASGEAVENDWLGGFVDVPRDACLLGYARGSTSIVDVDVAVYSDEGTQLAADEGRDPHPTVLLCAPHPDRVYVAAHVVEGEGLVVVGAQLVPKERATIVARGLGARGAGAPGPRAAEAWPGLDDVVREHRSALGGSWEEVKRVALSVDTRAPTYVSVPIEADQCVDAVIVPDADVGLLDVEAYDEEGRVVARAREGTGERTLTVCSPVAMPRATLSVRPHVGRGLAAVVLARARGDVAGDLSARPDIVWTAGSRSVDAARKARDALLAAAGYGPAVADTDGTLLLGRRLSVPLKLGPAAGACARVDVVAGAPLALLDARVWDDAGAMLASAEGASSVALFACAHGAAHVELETRGRPGPFALTVRPERWRDPVFAARPLAASRMLARAAVGPERLFEGKAAAAARAFSLDAARRFAWTETVPPGRCVRATVGVQGEGAGVELRAFDRADGSTLDRAEAAYAASVRACAPATAARAVAFEVGASAGHLEAVVGERTSE